MTQTNLANKLGHQRARPSCDICRHFPKRHQVMWVKMPWSTEAHGIVNYTIYIYTYIIYIYIPLCQHIPTTSHLISLAEISWPSHHHWIRGPWPGLDFVDLIHIDIQFAESTLLAHPGVQELLRSRAARIIVGSHSPQIHQELVSRSAKVQHGEPTSQIIGPDNPTCEQLLQT